MSLHIKLPGDKDNLKSKIEIAVNFIESLGEDIKITYFNIQKNGETLKREDGFQKDRLFGHLKGISEYEKITINIFYILKGYKGYLEINNDYQSNFAGHIELELFDTSISSLLSDDSFKKKFETFTKSLSTNNNLVKSYVDLNEEGEDNPLDIIYEYEPRGLNMIIKVIKALEILSYDDSELEDLYMKIRGSDKNYVASRLWSNDKIRKMIFDIADSRGIIAQEGSIMLYAHSKDEMKEYYLAIIHQILNPIFNKTPPLEHEIEEFTNKLDN